MQRTISHILLAEKVSLINLYRKLGFPFQMPYKYIFILTNMCQSRCKTCKIWKIYKDNPKKLKTELDLEEYEKIFENIKRDALWLNLSGGESFLRKDIDEIAINAIENFKNMFILNIPTNGLETKTIKKKTRRILEAMSGPTDFFITLSLDGTQRIHDSIRGVKGGYKKVMKTYRTLIKFEKEFSNFHIGFQTTINKHNIDNIKTIFKTTQKSSPIFTFAHEANYFYNLGSEDDMRKLNDPKLLNIIRFLHKNYNVTNLRDFVPKIYLKLAPHFFKNPNKLVLPCTASYATITVDPYGNVMPCSYFHKSIANLRKHNYNLKKILMGKKTQALRKMIRNGECPRCWANCEAYPSIFHNFPLAIKKTIL